MTSVVPTKPNRPKFIRKQAVAEKLGVSKGTVENLIRDGLFIKPVQIGARAIGFVEAEVDAWMQARMAARRSEGSAA